MLSVLHAKCLGATDAAHRRSSGTHSSASPQPLSGKPLEATLLSPNKGTRTCRHRQRFPDPENSRAPGPPGPGLAGCGPGRGELPGSWTMLMNMTLAGLLSGVEQQKVPVCLEVHLLCAGPGVAQEWTSVPSALSDTPRPLSQSDFCTDGGTPREDREVNTEAADAPSSRLPSPLTPP